MELMVAHALSFVQQIVALVIIHIVQEAHTKMAASSLIHAYPLQVIYHSQCLKSMI
jgi:hypothetical protein